MFLRGGETLAKHSIIRTQTYTDTNATNSKSVEKRMKYTNLAKSLVTCLSKFPKPSISFCPNTPSSPLQFKEILQLSQKHTLFAFKIYICRLIGCGCVDANWCRMNI